MTSNILQAAKTDWNNKHTHANTTCVRGEMLGDRVLATGLEPALERTLGRRVSIFQRQANKFARHRPETPSMRLATHVFRAESWPSHCPTEGSPSCRSSPCSLPACRAGKVLFRPAACDRWLERKRDAAAGKDDTLKSQQLKSAARSPLGGRLLHFCGRRHQLCCSGPAAWQLQRCDCVLQEQSDCLSCAVTHPQ